MEVENRGCRISVIVPVYNAEATLNRCVDSILAQTYTNFELILVDDGSHDRSGEVIDQYATQDSRVVAIHKTNGGVSSARNAGLDRARGDYVVFVDADDEARPWWIERFMDIIGSADIAVQGIDFVGSDIFVKSIGEKCGMGNKELTTLLMTNDILGFLFCKLFRRDIINNKKIRFNEQLRFREDDVFVLNYLEHVEAWKSTDTSNYLYYVPSRGKEYGNDTVDCTELLIKSLNVIFDNQLPLVILHNIAWSTKASVVNMILNNRTIPKELMDVYRQTFPSGCNVRKILLNFLIINYHWLRPFSRTILRVLN